MDLIDAVNMAVRSERSLHNGLCWESTGAFLRAEVLIACPFPACFIVGKTADT